VSAVVPAAQTVTGKIMAAHAAGQSNDVALAEHARA
jgi:hypothetical protein